MQYSPKIRILANNQVEIISRFHILSDSGVGLHFVLCEVSQHSAKNQRVIVKDGHGRDKWEFSGLIRRTQMTQTGAEVRRK